MKKSELIRLKRQPTHAELVTALEQLVILQGHYATLLNAWDGSERHAFENADEWIARLRKTGTLPSE